MRCGWDGKKRVQHIILYLQIQNGKIWVEEDAED
ncbi:element excision factor XisI family protein [Scytonema hofmannii]